MCVKSSDHQGHINSSNTSVILLKTYAEVNDGTFVKNLYKTSHYTTTNFSSS